MANRLPLVFDAATNKRIEELPTGDNLSLVGNNIVDVIDITATGTLTVPNLNVDNLNITGTETSAVAISGDYNDLINKPNLFSGDYNDLTNKPVLAPDWADITNKPVVASKLSQLVNDTNFVTNAQVAIQSTQVTDLAIVATTGSFTDLLNVPNFVTNEQIFGGTLTVEVSNTGDLQGSVFADDSTLMVDHLNNQIFATKISVTEVNADLLSGDDLAIFAPDGLSLSTENNFTLTGETFQLRNNFSGTDFADDIELRFRNILNFEFATVNNLSADIRGSVIGIDSTIIVDQLTGTISATDVSASSLTVSGNISATEFAGNIRKTGSSLNIQGDSGIQMLPTGIFNVPNATQITLAGTLGITLNATSDLVLSSSSGVIDLTDNTINFNNSIIQNFSGDNLIYTPETSSDWAAPAPQSISDAIDRLAAWITANGGAGSP